MGKKVKMLTTVIMTIIIITTFADIVLAGGEALIRDVGEGGNVDTGTVENFGKAAVSIARVVGVSVAVVILLVLGIKYMLGSPEARAEYKRTMIPYLIGAILVFASTSVVVLIYNIVTSIDGGSSSQAGAGGGGTMTQMVQ